MTMATIRGNSGVMELGAALAQITSYTLDTTQDTAESSAMGATGRTYIKTMHGYSGSADFVLEGGTDTPQFDTIVAMDFSTDTGETAAFKLYPEGDASGNVEYTGDAIITGVSYTAAFDGIVTGSVTFQGTGDLTSTLKA